MLKDAFRNKNIAIVGFQTVAAKILLRKLMGLTEGNIIAVVVGKNLVRSERMMLDPYFTQEQQVKIKSQVQFIPLSHLEQHLSQTQSKKIDILFSLYEPVDFSNEEKMINNHLLATGSIISVLSHITIDRCLLLSSIYLKDPGYVGEDEDMDQQTIPHRFADKQETELYLSDNFRSKIEGWKWTIRYIEENYASISKQITVIRVPSLGPTLNYFEGYSGQLTSLTYLLCQVGLGNITSLDGIKNNKIDIVPADFASNLLLVLSVQKQHNRAQVVNLSTTTRHYITLQQFVEISREAWHEYGQKPAKIKIIQTELGQRLKHGQKEIRRYAGFGFLKIDGQLKSQEQQQRLSVIKKYKYFLCKEWLCQSVKTIDLFNQLSLEQQSLYNFNVNSIKWKIYVKLCVYSMKKYVLNHPVQQFKPESMDMLGTYNKESYFSDIMWAMRSGKQAGGQTRKDAVQFVLNSKSVKDAINSIIEESMMRLQNPPTSFQKAEEELTKVAEQLCVQMFSDYSMRSIRMFGWFLHKLFSNIYQKVVVDKTDIAKIRNHRQADGPLIIIPTHRSYIDFLIISYVFFGYGIKCPHIAAAEDFLNMAVVHILLRRSGAFFIKRNQKKYKQLYKAILNQYLSKMLISKHYIQFFVQGTRSRTGKMLTPKFGILSVIAQNVAEGRVPDAFILPVTVNYQKILEGSSYTYEMMGESKVKESLSRVLKSVDVLKQNYGRIHLQFCNMISVKEWLGNNQETFPQKIQKLGYKIVRDLSNKVVISGPAIISTVVLMNRKGISDDSLQQQTTWLSKQISSRGIKITRSQPDSSISVNSTLSLLQGIISKSKKDMFEVEVSFDQSSFVKLFTLTYYRNTLGHIFFQEAVVATALASFQYKPITEGIQRDALFQRTVFLWNIFQKEYPLLDSLANRARFDHILSYLVTKNIVIFDKDRVRAINLTGNYYNFYWSLIWPLVQSYWITCLYFFKLQKTATAIPLNKLLTQIQWFAQSLINDRICSYLEAISSDTIKNAVNTFIQMKLVTSNQQEIKGEQVQVIKLAVPEPELRAVLQRLGQYQKTTYARSLKGILQANHSSVNLDFPFLSRL